MRGIAAGLLLVLGTLTAIPQTAPPPHAEFYRVGQSTDVQVHPRAGYALMGGGTDLYEAFRWLCARADGGDFVVLRASGTDAYDPYINGLCGLNSVTTVVIPDREAALESRVEATIRHAAAIFIAGGDQSKYTHFWRGTPVEAALRDAVKRGIPIGGTSAGLAVMGEFIYSAEGDRPDDHDLTSDEAMADPFNRQVVVSPDLLGIPILRGVIIDTHFDTRQREGRLVTFMARILEQGQTKKIRGIGVSEKTALLVEPNGEARAVGKSLVDFLEEREPPLACKPGEPLQIRNVIGQSIEPGESFDLRKWKGPEKQFVVDVALYHGRPDLSNSWY